MEEYGGNMDHDWDLQAVVRGCSKNSHRFSRNFMENNSHFENNMHRHDMDAIAQQQEAFLFSSSPVSCGVIEAKGGLVSSDELQLLYQPFYSVPHHQEAAVFAAAEEAQVKQEQGSLNASVFDFDSITSTAPPPPPPVLISASSTRAAKSSRKNQQKRVVKQMTADCLSADKWAWRKYGQKPIKGSPFPRSYYRCSSSKGCPARKQVERSSSDPHIFILTYTAEHSHAHPTRRNTLAGVTRKLSLRRKTSNGNSHSRPVNMIVDLSSSSTPFVVQATDETPRHSSMLESRIKVGEDMTGNVEDNNNQVSDMMNEFDGLTSDVVSDCWFDELQASSSHWLDERSVASS